MTPITRPTQFQNLGTGMVVTRLWPLGVVVAVALVCLTAMSCSTKNDAKPAANSGVIFDDDASVRVVLEDGVYPVVLAEEAMPTGDSEIKIVELSVVPVEGSEDSPSDKIRVTSRPLLRFRNVSKFDFAFEQNECTAIGFENTDELKAYTRDRVGSRLAVVINNQVITHHKIRQEIKSDEVRITCCTVGGGDHLHKHLKELKLASHAVIQTEADKGDERDQSKNSDDAFAKLNGAWVAESVLSSGKESKDKFPFEVQFDDENLLFNAIAGMGKDRKHSITLAMSDEQSTMDITRVIGGNSRKAMTTVLAIYKFEGDRLLICSLRGADGQPATERPTLFESTPENRADLMILKRKPASENEKERP